MLGVFAGILNITIHDVSYLIFAELPEFNWNPTQDKSRHCETGVIQSGLRLICIHCSV